MFQVRKKDTRAVYAMKVMRKERILAKDHGDYVKAERDVLTAVFHPYIVTLRCSFQAGSLIFVCRCDRELAGWRAPEHEGGTSAKRVWRGPCFHADHVQGSVAPMVRIQGVLICVSMSAQTASKLYLVLDFVNGGHLFFQLYRQGIFDEDLARLYTAELVLAIAHLHSLGIAHRDLKPVRAIGALPDLLLCGRLS